MRCVPSSKFVHLMEKLQITSFRPGAKSLQKPHLFVLCKGLNSGKPMLSPCPNCFVIQLQNEDEKEQIYWLLYGLWQSNAFHPFLRGSVIPFITIKDASNCIREGYTKAIENPADFQKSVTTLRSLEAMEMQFKQNLHLIDQAKQMLFQRYILRR